MNAVNVRIKEWQRLAAASTGEGRVLENVWLEDASARALARHLTVTKTLGVEELRLGLSLHATSYVGRVSFGNVTVTVEPKIAPAALLALFRYAFRVRHLPRFDRSLAGAGLLFQDLLLEQLRAEVDELRRRGLLQTYVARRDLLATPRGRIDCERLASRGGLIDATIPCRHTPRDVDNVLNRALVAGVALGARIASAPQLRRDLLELERLLDPAIVRCRLDVALLHRAETARSRLAKAYEPALAILPLLLSGTAIALDDGATVPIPGFLFDMNRLFQALVERLLQDHLPTHETHSEVGLAGMMAYIKNPKSRHAPTPRPDFAVTDKTTGTVMLLDAKYRDLWGKSLPREMLYQLALYATSKERDRAAAIVYPAVDAAPTEAVVEVKRPTGGERIATVHLRPLDVVRLAEAIEAEDVRALGKVAIGLAAR